MKKLIAVLVFLTPASLAFAQDELSIFNCQYTISRPGKADFVISGNLIANDVATPTYTVTYLTLAPNELSGNAGVEARILITTDGFNPITLHKPGNSATTLASGELKAAGGEVSYADDTGAKFLVHCAPR